MQMAIFLLPTLGVLLQMSFKHLSCGCSKCMRQYICWRCHSGSLPGPNCGMLCRYLRMQGKWNRAMQAAASEHRARPRRMGARQPGGHRDRMHRGHHVPLLQHGDGRHRCAGRPGRRLLAARNLCPGAPCLCPGQCPVYTCGLCVKTLYQCAGLLDLCMCRRNLCLGRGSRARTFIPVTGAGT